MSSKRQSIISIGIGLIIVGAILLVFAFSEPKEPVSSLTDAPSSTLSSNTTASNSGAALTQVENTTAVTAQGYSSTVSKSSAYSEPAAVTYPLNLNTCSVQELMSIDGIGENRASAIIQYREYLGGYTSIEQIKEIKGFGDSLYQKIAPYITV